MKMDDNLFEALFRQAVIEEFKKEVESIPKKDELIKIVTLSPEFELRMRRLLARDRRRDIVLKAIHVGKRVAAIILLAVGFLSLLMLSNAKVRASVKEAIVEWYNKYISIIFNGQEASDTSDIKEFRPKYLPKGFKESQVEKDDDRAIFIYQNDFGDSIYVSYWHNYYNANILIDNENHIIETRMINGYEVFIAYAIQENPINVIVWTMDNYQFRIWSTLSMDELIMMAESMCNN